MDEKLPGHTNGVLVRQLEPSDSDISRVIALEELCFNRFDQYNKNNFMRWIGSDPELCLVAEINSQIVGDIISGIREDRTELASLAIHPDFRRQGVGRVLVLEICRRVKAAGINKIDIEVRKSNLGGIRFWRKMGFRNIGEQPSFYEDGENALLLRKELYSGI